MKDKALEAHIKNNTVAACYLLIDRDIAKLQAIAKWFSGNYHPADIFCLFGSPNILVKETEDLISLSNLAAVGGKKLILICDASTMTIAAQNKILKTIEDTPADTTFMLLASSADKILNTIKSRSVTIYPDPLPPDSTDPLAKPTLYFKTAARDVLESKTLDDALPHIKILKTDIPHALAAFNFYADSLTIPKRADILKALSIINRNIIAGCNPQNAFDILIMEIFK